MPVASSKMRKAAIFRPAAFLCWARGPVSASHHNRERSYRALSSARGNCNIRSAGENILFSCRLWTGLDLLFVTSISQYAVFAERAMTPRSWFVSS